MHNDNNNIIKLTLKSLIFFVRIHFIYFWNKSFYSLGADGFGRSDTRKNLRKFFEVDKEHLVAYGLSILAKEQLITSKYAKDAMKKYNIDSNKPMPTKL